MKTGTVENSNPRLRVGYASALKNYVHSTIYVETIARDEWLKPNKSGSGYFVIFPFPKSIYGESYKVKNNSWQNKLALMDF